VRVIRTDRARSSRGHRATIPLARLTEINRHYESLVSRPITLDAPVPALVTLH
jgi:hypothetical protein